MSNSLDPDQDEIQTVCKGYQQTTGFCYGQLFFFLSKINFFKKLFQNTIRVSKGLDPDQD